MKSQTQKPATKQSKKHTKVVEEKGESSKQGGRANGSVLLYYNY
jgi:hypothetical protein